MGLVERRQDIDFAIVTVKKNKWKIKKESVLNYFCNQLTTFECKNGTQNK